MLEDRLDLRAENHPTWQVRVVQGLHAYPVTREKQLAPAGVPDCEREHAIEPLHAARSLFLIEMNDRLGVGGRPERVSPSFELASQGLVVVHLAVVRDPNGSIL